jgi:Glycosyltransferases involved in cell wall biogenesis
MELDEKPLISIIVPVFNVAPYLRKCLDSILNQTYENLEIIIIDDGSTDGSGSVCDEYKKDERVKVFHTENRGLSAARNKGLDEANGDWIGFADSDDWIEPDMYEVLQKKAEETGADVVEWYPDRTERHKRRNVVLNGSEAIRALLNEELSENAWNKLWRKDCFDNTRFPTGRIFEDIATTYKIYSNINSFCSLTDEKYHYEQRRDSLSRQRTMKNLSDFWLSHFERYGNLQAQVDEKSRQRLLFYCASAAARTWAYYYDCMEKERNTYLDVIREMNLFIKKHIPLLGFTGWGIAVTSWCFLSTFS